jgi:hypothetical protein
MQQRCKAYAIRGPDRSRTSGAVRCLRDAHSSVTIESRTFPLCSAHDEGNWKKFLEDSWLYVIDVTSEPIHSHQRDVP